MTDEEFAKMEQQLADLIKSRELFHVKAMDDFKQMRLKSEQMRLEHEQLMGEIRKELEELRSQRVQTNK